jgi:L-lysine 2,3-aminomutase
MSNPKGNPNIKEYGFTTDRPESLTAKLSMRVAPSMLDELKKKDNWQEIVRQAIAEKLQSTTSDAKDAKLVL